MLNGLDGIKEWFNLIQLDFDENIFFEITNHLKPISFSKGEHLIKIGEVEKNLYLIMDGFTRTYFEFNEKEICTRFCFKNEFVSSYLSYVTGNPSDEGIQALSDVTAFYVEYSNIRELFDNDERFKELRRRSFEFLYYERAKEQRRLLSLSAEDRYLWLMKKNKKFVQNIPIKYLATYLGIKPESLSRIRRNIGK